MVDLIEHVSIPLRSDFNDLHELKGKWLACVSIPLRSDFNQNDAKNS